MTGENYELALALAQNDSDLLEDIHDILMEAGLTEEAYAKSFARMYYTEKEAAERISYDPSEKEWRRAGHALSDIRQIDKMERDKLVGLDKLVAPPVAAPIQYKDAVCLHPHAVNYVASNDAIRPIIDLAPCASAFQHLREELRTVAGRIEDELLASAFASVSLDQRPSDMSATEFMERRREALQQLGPVMSAYEPNVLAPLLERVAGILDRKGMLPPPPESLSIGAPLAMKIDFVSPIANSLRQSGAESTRALVQDVLTLAQADPSALDKLDIDQTVDELATGLGVPGKVIRADADVQALRLRRTLARIVQNEDDAL